MLSALLSTPASQVTGARRLDRSCPLPRQMKTQSIWAELGGERRLGPQPRATGPYPRWVSSSGRQLQADLGKDITRLCHKPPSCHPLCLLGLFPTPSVSSWPCLCVGCHLQCPARAWPLRQHSPEPNPSPTTDMVGLLAWERDMAVPPTSRGKCRGDMRWHR